MLLLGLAVLTAAGCLRPRGEIYSELQWSRRVSYARWRDEADPDDCLVRVDGDLSVEEAVRLALEHNPTLQSTMLEREKARGRLYTARADGLPQVRVEAGYTRLGEGALVNTATGARGPRDNYSYQVNVTQPLYKGGAIAAGLDAARYYQLLSDEVVRQAVQDVAYQTVSTYYEVVLAEKLLQVQTEALEFAQANLRDVTAREERGVAIPFDRLRARVEVANVEAQVIQERNRLNRARTALMRLMGVSQKSEVAYVSDLTYVPVNADFETTVRTALLHRPELYRSELTILMQRAALEMAMSAYLPSLEAWGIFKRGRPDPHDSSRNDWAGQWQGGLRLAWTLFDGLRREGEVIQQRATVRQSLIDLADAEQHVFEEIKNALFDLTDADAMVRSQEFNLELAAEALRLVAIGVREGVNTELEVLDARSALTTAQGNYYQALHAHLQARHTLQRVVGLLAPEPGMTAVPDEVPPVEVLRRLEPLPASDEDGRVLYAEPVYALPVREDR